MSNATKDVLNDLRSDKMSVPLCSEACAEPRGKTPLVAILVIANLINSPTRSKSPNT